jgi:hypothetical protein
MKKKLLVVVILALASLGARADVLEDFSAQLREEITASDDAVAACGADRSDDRAANDSWYYRRFWLRVRPKLVFSIPGFAKLEIMPETELLWDRALPSGWVAYAPRPPVR